MNDEDLLDRLGLRGDEAVLDAGCGAGALTAQVLARVPRGRVVAIDASPELAARARRALPAGVDVGTQELDALVLPVPVDAVVSSGAFHRVRDHAALFRRLHAALRPGGRLEARCAGAGNAASVLEAVSRLRSRAPWDDALLGWEDPWHLATAEATTVALLQAGFADVECRLLPRTVQLDDPHAFLRTMVLGPLLERLPEEAHDPFVEAVRAELGGDGVAVELVRLEMRAVRSGDPGGPGPVPAGSESVDAITARLRG